LVEQRIENPRVGGSIPPRATKNSKAPRGFDLSGLFYIARGLLQMNAGIPNPADWLPTCTVRIEAEMDGVARSIGTGFFYDFELTPKPGDTVTKAPTIITNKHVVAGCDFAKVFVSVAPHGAAANAKGLFDQRLHVPARVALGQYVVDHPDPDVDLCAIPAAWLVARIEAKKQFQLINRRLWMGHRLAPKDREDARYIEPVVMVGYPSGLWDSMNNAPIVRRGSTATHPLVNYEGRPEFVIDAACFPGSSGSPVFLFQDGMYHVSGEPFYGIRTALLGILYAGPQFTAEGKLVPVPIPHCVGDVPVTSFPMNLGYVINADQLDVLQPLMQQRYDASPDITEEALRALLPDS
jgi:hypothetical protein